MYGGRENDRYSSDFLVNDTSSLGETKKPVWNGLHPGTRTIPRSGGSYRIPPRLPICDFPPALQRIPWDTPLQESPMGPVTEAAYTQLKVSSCYTNAMER